MNRDGIARWSGGWPAAPAPSWSTRPGSPSQSTAVAAAENRLRRGQTVIVRAEGAATCGVEQGRFRRAFFQAAVAAGAPVCPVAIRYRHGDGRPAAVAACAPDAPLTDAVTRVLAARDLVVEVRLLRALEPAGADRRRLAATAEAAIAPALAAAPGIAVASGTAAAPGVAA